jgi:hypothetical protein
MLWGERVRRRRALITILVLFALADLALAVVVMRGGSGATAQAALPMHPVVGSFLPDDTQLGECSDARCFEQAFGNIAYRQGPKAALALVDDVYGDGSDPACHQVIHYIGVASLARFHGDVTRTLAAGTPKCWSGYYHGVLERSLVNTKSRQPAALAAVARPMCASLSTTPWVVYGCLHGLGHGLMIATGLNLPISLETCSRLGRWWDRDACRGGVFMENISSSYGVHSLWLKDDDLLYPCDWVAYEAKRRCYQIVTSRILPRVDDDWGRTAEICAGVERDFVGWCFQSFGRDASSRSGRDPEKIASLCAIARPYGGEAACITAAAYDITANFTSAKPALLLCALVQAGVRARCYYGLGSVLGRFRKTDEARLADCRAIVSDASLVAACVQGGRENLPRA